MSNRAVTKCYYDDCFIRGKQSTQFHYFFIVYHNCLYFFNETRHPGEAYVGLHNTVLQKFHLELNTIN